MIQKLPTPPIFRNWKRITEFILGTKPDDHEYLYQLVDEAVVTGEAVEFYLTDSAKTVVYHCFRYVNDVPLNKSSEESLRSNFLEYWQTDDESAVKIPFAWVTDLQIFKEGASKFMNY